MAFYQNDQVVRDSYAIRKTGDLGLPEYWSCITLFLLKSNKNTDINCQNEILNLEIKDFKQSEEYLLQKN